MKSAVSHISLGSPYQSWLKEQGVPLFSVGDTKWQLYKEALIPASIGPFFTSITKSEADSLLRESGAWLLRYSTEPSEEETAWWYIVCDSYDMAKLTPKIRNQIRRGQRECTVRRIDAEWLAQFGYQCYSAAYARYSNAAPAGEASFSENILSGASGPVEYWGVFVGQELAGYCKCIVDGMDVATSVTKFDPKYLKRYASYALVSRLIDHYVVERGMRISNGNRPVAHETNYQDVLLRLGFRKQYGRLIVVYRPWLNAVIQILFPLRNLIALLPNRGLIHKLQAFLFQEELQRLCR